MTSKYYKDKNLHFKSENMLAFTETNIIEAALTLVGIKKRDFSLRNRFIIDYLCQVLEADRSKNHDISFLTNEKSPLALVFILALRSNNLPRMNLLEPIALPKDSLFIREAMGVLGECTTITSLKSIESKEWGTGESEKIILFDCSSFASIRTYLSRQTITGNLTLLCLDYSMRPDYGVYNYFFQNRIRIIEHAEGVATIRFNSTEFKRAQSKILPTR